MQEKHGFGIGLAGTSTTALCCFTPLAVWGLGAVGLGAVLPWLDWVLLPALAGFALLTAVTGWRLWKHRARRRSGPSVRLVWFEGCPHAAAVREQLRGTGIPFTDVCQDDLPPGDPLQGYTSPTVLAPDGTVLWGSASGEAGCTIAVPEPGALEDALRRAGLLLG